MSERLQPSDAAQFSARSRDALPSHEVDTHRRIVITGMGMVSPLGLGVEESWKNLLAGQTGLKNVEIPFTGISVAGVIDNFDPKIHCPPKVRERRMHRAQLLSVAASMEALASAGLLDSQGKLIAGIDPERFGTVIGTGVGGTPEVGDVDRALREGKKFNPFSILRVLPERVATTVSMQWGLQGPLHTPIAACATGNIAIINGYREIYNHDADIMVVGAVEAPVGSSAVAMFEVIQALSLSSDPRTASRPFDQGHSGFVMGEGAGILILEDYDHAIRREARILGEIIGYGNASDAYHETAPSGLGAERAMRLTLGKAGARGTEGIYYVNAHGTGTPTGDEKEVEVIAKVLPADKAVVSSTKSQTGHLLGAAGAIEAIFTMKAVETGMIPGTPNLENPLEEIGEYNFPNQTQEITVSAGISNSFGFGGINAVLETAPAPEDQKEWTDRKLHRVYSHQGDR